MANKRDEIQRRKQTRWKEKGENQRLDEVDRVRQDADSRDKARNIARNDRLFVKKMMWVDD